MAAVGAQAAMAPAAQPVQLATATGTVHVPDVTQAAQQPKRCRSRRRGPPSASTSFFPLPALVVLPAIRTSRGISAPALCATFILSNSYTLFRHPDGSHRVEGNRRLDFRFDDWSDISGRGGIQYLYDPVPKMSNLREVCFWESSYSEHSLDPPLAIMSALFRSCHRLVAFQYVAAQSASPPPPRLSPIDNYEDLSQLPTKVAKRVARLKLLRFSPSLYTSDNDPVCVFFRMVQAAPKPALVAWVVPEDMPPAQTIYISTNACEYEENPIDATRIPGIVSLRPSLRRLVRDDVVFTSNHAMANLLGAFPMIDQIELIRVRMLEEASINILESAQPLKLLRLEETEAPESALIQLLRLRGSALTHLLLPRNHRVTDSTLSAVAYHTPALEVLAISGCSYASPHLFLARGDEGTENLFAHAPSFALPRNEMPEPPTDPHGLRLRGCAGTRAGIAQRLWHQLWQRVAPESPRMGGARGWIAVMGRALFAFQIVGVRA
ncbi:hypothetical protein BDK51DRAFT_41686, partial [Blyttiomyces helicus]